MSNSESKSLLYSGTYISIIHLKEMLEERNIIPFIENDKASGITAGFGGGTDSTIRLYVLQNELNNAQLILEEFKNQMR